MAGFPQRIDACYVSGGNVHFELLLVGADLRTKLCGLCVVDLFHTRVLVKKTFSMLLSILLSTLESKREEGDLIDTTCASNDNILIRD